MNTIIIARSMITLLVCVAYNGLRDCEHILWYWHYHSIIPEKHLSHSHFNYEWQWPSNITIIKYQTLKHNPMHWICSVFICCCWMYFLFHLYMILPWEQERRSSLFVISHRSQHDPHGYVLYITKVDIILSSIHYHNSLACQLNRLDEPRIQQQHHPSQISSL